MQKRRELDKMPFDKAFENQYGQRELCHATGYEICNGDKTNPADWWIEYTDSEGNLYYGR